MKQQQQINGIGLVIIAAVAGMAQQHLAMGATEVVASAPTAFNETLDSEFQQLFQLLESAPAPDGSPAANLLDHLDFSGNGLTLFAPVDGVIALAQSQSAIPSGAELTGLLVNHVVGEAIDISSDLGAQPSKLMYTSQCVSSKCQFAKLLAPNAQLPYHALLFGAPVGDSDPPPGISPLNITIPEGGLAGVELKMLQTTNKVDSTIWVYGIAGIMNPKGFTGILDDANLDAKATGLLEDTGIMSTLGGFDRYQATLFFPTPEALAEALGDVDGDPGGDELEAIKRRFQAHIVPGQRLTSLELLQMDGEELSTADSNTKLTVKVESGPVIKIDGVAINQTAFDLVSSQGVLHVVNDLLDADEIARTQAPTSGAPQVVTTLASMLVFVMGAVATMF